MTSLRKPSIWQRTTPLLFLCALLFFAPRNSNAFIIPSQSSTGIVKKTLPVSPSPSPLSLSLFPSHLYGDVRRSVRKRDILFSFSPTSSSNKARKLMNKFYYQYHKEDGTSMQLRMASSDEENDDKKKDTTTGSNYNGDNNNDNSKSVTGTRTTNSTSPTSMIITTAKETWENSINTIQKIIPKPVLIFLQFINNFWNKIKWHLLTFSSGAVLAITALLIPLYENVNNIKEPVVLFETILSDIEQAYVEPVDTQQLFETGVSAMLASLDPYTEFESVQAAADMNESIEGRYGGVGLVISGGTTPSSKRSSKLLPDKAIQDSIKNNNNNNNNNINNNDAISDPKPISSSFEDEEEYDADDEDARIFSKLQRKIKEKGIRVVSAFEGYAFDYGLRVGDKLVQVDNVFINKDTSIEQVRNTLRGEPGTLVTISFERDGVDGIQTITMPRSVVRIRDVKLATLLGNPNEGYIGYIQLSGFSSDAGREVRNAITYLQRSVEDMTDRPLQGLVLDLRGNPGGLLTSAVDVASLLVPKGSDIVSAKGRGFPGILYRSRVDPILDTTQTKLAVLVNSNTASAAEIVSGAVQDLDVGLIVGQDRTFGKGLVQNVEELPYNTALKFTVAKYYTPSGRCIQNTNYKSGERESNNGKYIASKIEDKDRAVYYTRLGRTVRDGGGIEADYKVVASKASALELTLLRSGIFSEFASEWSKTHELTNNFDIDEDTYKSFQNFVNMKQKSGELQLEALYSKPLSDLKKALKASGYTGSEKSVEQLQARIVRDIQDDFNKYRTEIKEDISQNILARYLPESMLIERGIQKDPQVQAAVKLLSSRDNTFDKLLAQGSTKTIDGTTAVPGVGVSSINVASTDSNNNNNIRNSIKNIGDTNNEGFRSTIQW